MVALVPQWYLDYGETEWLERTKKALEGVECHHEEVGVGYPCALLCSPKKKGGGS